MTLRNKQKRYFPNKIFLVFHMGKKLKFHNRNQKGWMIPNVNGEHGTNIDKRSKRYFSNIFSQSPMKTRPPLNARSKSQQKRMGWRFRTKNPNRLYTKAFTRFPMKAKNKLFQMYLIGWRINEDDVFWETHLNVKL